jgi:hypothetical protein
MQQYFSLLCVYHFFRILSIKNIFVVLFFILKIPNSYILKSDMKDILNNMYFAIIIFTHKLKLNRYNGKHCTLRYCLNPPSMPAYHAHC